MRRIQSQVGYSLIELVLVIIIIGIIASIAMKSLRSVNDTARVEETKRELDRLAWAVAGDPNLVSGGVRTDFGYVGDVGSMPPNLDALVSNPGSYATWDGPYIQDDFSIDGSNTQFKLDAWGQAYSYSAGNTLTSTGGGTTITREIANSTGDLLINKVAVMITDLGGTPPGAAYKDSVKFLLTCPNGSGSTTTKTRFPGTDGFAEFDSIPIGIHTLRIVYIPDNDTLTRKVGINPGQDSFTEVHLFKNVWP